MANPDHNGPGLRGALQVKDRQPTRRPLPDGAMGPTKHIIGVNGGAVKCVSELGFRSNKLPLHLESHTEIILAKIDTF